MAPIKTLKIASVATLAYSIYVVRNSESICRNWFLETLGTPEVKEPSFFGKLLLPIKLPICMLDMLAKKACVPSIYHQPKVAIEELRPFLKKLCSYEFIDDEEFNGKAIQFLELYEKTLEPELLWRLARACVERSRFTIVNGRKISPEEKVYFIKKAFELGREALKQAKESSSGAHKWYAITLITLMKEYAPSDQLSCFNNSKKFRKTLAPTDGDVQAEIRAHLERAVELDPKDHYAWYILGTQYRAIKDQEKASKCFEKAGDIQVAI